MIKIVKAMRNEKGSVALVEGCGPCCGGKKYLSFISLPRKREEKIEEIEIPLTDEQFEAMKRIFGGD